MRKYRIFIADDSEVLCERLMERLGEFEAVEVVGLAHKVSDAVESIAQTKPDAAILDIRMPDGTGIEVLESIKKSGALTKVIMFTNYPYPQYQKKCMEAGADYFFDKYTEYEKLYEVIKQLSDHHRRTPVSK